MSSQKKKVNLNQELIIGFVITLLVNYISARALGYPFLFCWTWPLIADLYIAFGTFIVPCAFAAAVYFVFRRRVTDSLFAVGLMIAYTKLPQGLEFLLRPGGSCG